MIEVLKKPINYIKDGISNVAENVAEGWDYLMRNTKSALTKFDEPEVTWEYNIPVVSWGFMAGDITYTDSEVIARLEIPGLNKEEIKVAVYGNYISVKGEKKRKREGKKQYYYLTECAYGYFERIIPLPFQVEREGTEAEYENGVLEIRMPYKVKRRKIPVN